MRVIGSEYLNYLCFYFVFQGEIVAQGSFNDIRMSGIDLVSMCPLKKSIEEEEELQKISETVTPKTELRHRRHSNASTSSSKFMDWIRPQVETSHHVTEILEENEGETGAFQVPVYVSNSLTLLVKKEIAFKGLSHCFFHLQEEEGNPKEEGKHEGAVAITTYVSYFKSLHNACAAIFVLMLFVLAQVCPVVPKHILSHAVPMQFPCRLPKQNPRAGTTGILSIKNNVCQYIFPTEDIYCFCVVGSCYAC